MSAESPRRGSRGGGTVVRPQPVSDKSVMQSVVGFIQDVANYTGSHPTQKPDDKEKVQWVHFEQADLNDIVSNPDCVPQSGNTAPLLLVLGYSNGVQVWSIPASGEAQELLSLRQGPVRTFRLLPHPKPVFNRPDTFGNKRPLVAMCDASSAGQPYCSVKFMSLRTGDEVHNISFSYPVCDIRCNDRVVVVAFSERIAVFDACQFKQRFLIMSCYPAPGHNPNPIALGTRWLAYADKKLVPVHQSCGGMTGDGGQSYAATVISAAKSLTKGLTIFGGTVASSLTGTKPPPAKKEPQNVDQKTAYKPGVVTIVDIQNTPEGTQQMAVQEDSDGEGLVAHFPAHAAEPVTGMAFDPSGTMLLTADRLGHNFHVFRVMSHPWNCSLGAVHHLYTLHRGDTTAKVQDIAFTYDSRWVAISTLRGTTHVFPITPYGGPVNYRTHSQLRVVNRASKFHRSAGIEDLDPRAAGGRHSPVPVSSSPGSSPGRSDHYRQLMHPSTLHSNMGNPRLPPYPHPSTVYPLVQIKQSLVIPGLGSSGGSGTKTKTSASQTTTPDSVCVAAVFARSRGWVAGSPNLSREKGDEKRAVDSLYIISWTGNLIEYILDPHAKSGLDKITDDSPLETTETPRAQWSLGRSMTAGELRAPLPSTNPLILGCDAVVSQRPSSGDLAVGLGLVTRQESKESLSSDHSSCKDEGDEQWLSQVEIITHAGPHRRLWMGPQFSFKTFQGTQTATVLASNSSVLLSQSPESTITTMDLVSEEVDLQSLKIQPARSSPVAMPGARRSHRHSSGSDPYTPPIAAGTLLIEAEMEGHSPPGRSYEQSPSLVEAYSSWPENSAPVQSGEVADERLRERLADAMVESPAKDRATAAARHVEAYQGSLENLSTSSGSTSSATRAVLIDTRSPAFDARSSPPHSIEHVLVLPSGSVSPDSS